MTLVSQLRAFGLKTLPPPLKKVKKYKTNLTSQPSHYSGYRLPSYKPSVYNTLPLTTGETT